MTPEISSSRAKNASVALIHNWPLTLLSGALLPLLVALGIWQIQRGGEKAAIEATINQRLSSQPVSPQNLDQLRRYTPLRLSGYYTGDYRLLDNRTRNGRVGYELLQVFVSDGQRWLINRGWLPAPEERSRLPEVTWPRAAKVITGFLYPVSATETPGAAHGQRIQQLDRQIAVSLDLTQPQWTVRLSADSDTALVTDWQLLNSRPQRHYAYAAQWFVMAAALVLLWLFAATRIVQLSRRNNDNNNDNRGTSS